MSTRAMIAMMADNGATDEAIAGAAVRRRGLIAGAAALAAGLLAMRAGDQQQVGAVPPSLLLGNNDDVTNTETATTTLVATGTTVAQGGLRVKISYTGGVAPPVPDPTRDAIQGYATNPMPNPAPITSNAGVHGRNDDLNGIGVAGVASSGTGVYGQSSNGSAVGGSSGGATAVYGKSAGTALTPANTTMGVYGEASGNATGSIGIYGANLSTTAKSHGIVGLANVAGHGLVGTSNSVSPQNGEFYAGLVGLGNNGSNAGNFYGNVAITGTLNGHGAIMTHPQVAVAHPDGSHRLAHSVSATEAWLEEVGSGKLVVGGKASIALDAEFAVLADLSDYHVFLTEYDGHHALYVTDRTASGFAVHAAPTPPAAGGGAVGTALTTATFSWKVMARRKDAQGGRLATFTYPKLVAPEIAVRTAPSEAQSISRQTPLPLPNRR